MSNKFYLTRVSPLCILKNIVPYYKFFVLRLSDLIVSKNIDLCYPLFASKITMWKRSSIKIFLLFIVLICTNMLIWTNMYYLPVACKDFDISIKFENKGYY